MMNELEPLESDEIFMKFIMRVVKLLKWKLHDLPKKKNINFRTFLLNNKNIFHENDIFFTVCSAVVFHLPFSFVFGKLSLYNGC